MPAMSRSSRIFGPNTECARSCAPISRMRSMTGAMSWSSAMSHVHHRVGEGAARAGDHADLAVGHEVHVALVVAQLHVAQRHVFDQAALAGDLHHVTLADLVAGQQEEAAEEILDQRLRAEGDRDAGHAGGGEERQDGNAQRIEHRQRRDRGDQRGRELAQHVADRGGAPLRFDVVRMRAVNFSRPPIRRRAMNTRMKVTARMAAMRPPAWIQSIARTIAPLWSLQGPSAPPQKAKLAQRPPRCTRLLPTGAACAVRTPRTRRRSMIDA